MINEVYTRNRFRRLINQYLPFRWRRRYEYLHTEYQIPDVLDHRLQEPGGTVLFYKGPRNNLEIICNTKGVDIPFKVLAPIGTRFSIYDISGSKYAYIFHRNLLIEIPSGFLGWEGSKTRWLLHETNHLWNNQDEEWDLRFSNAYDLLNDTSISYRRDPHNEFLPFNYERKEQELEAERICGQSERRADAGALYMIGRLRKAGVDIMLGLNISDLKRMFNYNAGLRKKHRYELGFDFRFSTREVSALLLGELPYPRLKEILDVHLDQVIADTGIIRTPLPFSVCMTARR